MYKLSPLVSSVLVLVVVFLLFRQLGSKSSYRLSPSGVTVSAKSSGSLFELPSELDCVPGPTQKGSYYTKDLTPGGVCGAQKFVDDQASYTITGGIGGSLMDE